MASSIGPWVGGGRRRGAADWDMISDPFSYDLWDPFDYGLSGGLSGWGLGGRRGGEDDVSALAHANVDWRETDTAHVFRVDLPGVRKEDLKVQVEDGNTLEISGERVKEEEQVDDKWHRVERRRGKFLRRFRLPKNANADEIKCGLEHGVLTVNVPKKETQVFTRNVRAIDVA
ncbi:16.9 kDa class I heat shock protein 1-like [Nicotiana tomentosiformis]|uniref:16.9 kDa class I heat shock protein 1-like n=1 Tax=Nicotiana tomentosiformis TaxID=4098 RepID=UPI00051C3881|nr:16.9 kDa class I heat shock protein 1-like [Nicotiana tomentosiformis]